MAVELDAVFVAFASLGGGGGGAGRAAEGGYDGHVDCEARGVMRVVLDPDVGGAAAVSFEYFAGITRCAETGGGGRVSDGVCDIVMSPLNLPAGADAEERVLPIGVHGRARPAGRLLSPRCGRGRATAQATTGREEAESGGEDGEVEEAAEGDGGERERAV